MDFSLSESNIKFLKNEIGKSGITYSHLMDELIDHVCCDVENEMRNGLPFEKAYEVVKNKIGIEGLERVQHETLYLIDKKYRIMKNTMKISGLIAPILLAFGALSKIQHWPYAGILLALGFFLLSFVFLPSAIYVNYKEVSNRTRRWTHITGFLGTFFISAGFLFKIQHWPFAGSIIAVGILLICLIFLPMVLNNRLRDKTDPVPKFIYFIAFAGFMIYMAAVLFKIMHWNYVSVLFSAGGLLLVFIAFPFYVYHMYRNNEYISTGFLFIVIVLVWFVIPTTLISLNLSADIIQNTHKMDQSMSADLLFIEESNAEYLTQVKENALANGIAERADKLCAIIEEMKVELKSNEIPDSTGLERLAYQVKELEKEALLISDDSNFASVIVHTLADPLKAFEQSYTDPVILTHKLTFLQLNIRLAEQAALGQLQLTEKKNSLALTL